MGDWTPISVAESVRVQPSLAHALATIGGDNGTPFYLNFPDMPAGLQWVFPFTYGFLYPLPVAFPKQQPFRIWSDQTPPGFPAAPSSSALGALTAFEDALPFARGVQTASGPLNGLPIGQVAVGGGGRNTTLQLPPGTVAIALGGTGAGALGTLETLTGGSGTVYVTGQSGPSSSNYGIYRIDPTETTVTVHTQRGGGGFFWNATALLAYPDPDVGPQLAAASLPVVIAQDQSAISVTPTLAPTGTASAAGGSTLVAAVAGQTVRIFGGTCNIAAGAAGSSIQLQDSGGGIIDVFTADNVGNVPFDFDGAPIGLGLGLKVVYGGGPPTGRISLAYSQA